jgi:hypothetical protein
MAFGEEKLRLGTALYILKGGPVGITHALPVYYPRLILYILDRMCRGCYSSSFLITLFFPLKHPILRVCAGLGNLYLISLLKAPLMVVCYVGMSGNY